VRVRQAAQDLATKRSELALLKTQESTSASALEEAESKLAAVVDASRIARRLALEQEQDGVTIELKSVREQLIEAQTGEGKQQSDGGKESAEGKHQSRGGNQPGEGKHQSGGGNHQSGAAKQQRKELARKASGLEQQAARIKRDIDALRSWSPLPQELTVERDRVNQARTARKAAQDATGAGLAEVRRFETLANEPFGFKAPPRLPGPAVPQDAAIPAVPDEEPPELGQLFENRGKRFLAIKTWEQVPPAIPVAQRLRAELVSLSDNNK